MITNLLVALGIGAATGLFKHVTRNEGIKLPRVVNDGEDKVLKFGFLQDIFLPAFSSVVACLLFASDASLVTVVGLSLVTAGYVLNIKDRRVQAEIIEQYDAMFKILNP